MKRQPELDLDGARPVRALRIVPEEPGDLRECLRLASLLSAEIRALGASIRDRAPAPKLRGDE